MEPHDTPEGYRAQVRTEEFDRWGIAGQTMTPARRIACAASGGSSGRSCSSTCGVALAKLAWGLVSGSAAMQADGFHSLFDGASNVVGLVGMSVAGRAGRPGSPVRTRQVRDVRVGRHRRDARLRRVPHRLERVQPAARRERAGAGVGGLVRRHDRHPLREPHHHDVGAARGQAARERDPRRRCAPTPARTCS